MNKKLISLLLITILAISAIAVFAGCDPNPGKNPPVEEQPTPQEPTDGGMAMLPESNGQGMRLLSTRILRPQFEEEGINPLAESAQQLTAVVTPADATNKVVDWAIKWNNASSEWASGKKVTDYVTVTPTSNGALTANVACLQAFAEKIVIRVSVRTDPGIYAEATVDYEQRVIGFNFSITNTWTGNDVVKPVNWSMTTANLNPVVDFPRPEASTAGIAESWGLGFADPGNTMVHVEPIYSIYTKAYSGYVGYKISVAPTAEYIAALNAAGFNVTGTAGNFSFSKDSDASGESTNVVSVADLMFAGFVSQTGGFTTVSQYTNMRSSLSSNVAKTMLQIKIEILGGTEKDLATVYNLKFSEASLVAIIDSITLNPGTITF